MRVWRDFRAKSEAMPSLTKRGCWMKCYGCGNEWKRIETKMVHMVILVIEGKQDTRFACDGCVDEFEQK